MTNALFTIDSKDYDIIESEFEFSQSINQSGMPSGKPTGGLIHIIIKNTVDTANLVNWMFDEKGTKTGSLKFILFDGKLKEIKFTDGICINYHEYFNMSGTDDKPSMLLKLTISAKEITVGDNTQSFKSSWNNIK